MNLPTVPPDREPLTEAEARRVGVSAFQMARLRSVVAHLPLGGQLTIKTNSGGAASIELPQLDVEAVLALLVEREALFLASFNVTVEKTV